MLRPLRTPYADTRASDLSWLLGLDPVEALAVLPLDLGVARLELRLLGASHQVLAEIGDGRLSEVVACLPGRQGALPGRAEETVMGLRYVFSSTTTVFVPEQLTATVAALRQELDASPQALVGVFPGALDAVTALVAEPVPSGVTWRTWHAYPDTGELATTTTRVTAS